MTNVDNALVLSRTLEAPRAAIWRCWSEADLLQQWFCPKPWFVTDAIIDLRSGGEFSSVMNGPNGEKFENVGVVLHVEPGTRLVTTDAFRPDWMPGARAFMIADIHLEDADNGFTHYTATARHWTLEAKQEHENMGFHEGWGLAADQLETLAQSLSKDTN